MWGIMSIVNRPPINSNNGDEHYEALVNRETKIIRSMTFPEFMLPFH